MQVKNASNSPWLEFMRPHVRDLAYTIACPPVLLDVPTELVSNTPSNLVLPTTNFWKQHFENYLPRLRALDANPKPLNQFLGKNLKNFRLGFRFEAMLLFWLLDNDYHEYQLLAHNIQIFRNNKTLGELDFIVKNTRTQQVEHWEVAIKFFLGEHPFSPSHWKGLRGTDNLAKKITHMFTKSFIHDVIDMPKDTISIDKRICIIKGRFYEPQHELKKLQTTYLPWLNHALPRGIWLNHIPQNIQAQEWRNGRRVEWFTKRDCYDSFDIHAFSNNSKRRNPLIWQTGLFFHLFPSDTAHQNKQGHHFNSVMLRLEQTPTHFE